MDDLNTIDYKAVLDLVTSLLHVKTVSAFSEMIINSKEQIGFDFVVMTEMHFQKSVTHSLVFTDDPLMKGAPEFSVPSHEYEKNDVYNQILSGQEVVKSFDFPPFIKKFRSLCGTGETAGTPDNYSSHILSKMNRETMTANLITFVINDEQKSTKFDLIAAYLHIHLMSAYVRIMSARDVMQEKLSEREKSVLTWLKHGKTSWEVAKILDITENTVNFHIKNIKRKLNATNRQHAVAIAIAKGAIE